MAGLNENKANSAELGLTGAEFGKTVQGSYNHSKWLLLSSLGTILDKKYYSGGTDRVGRGKAENKTHSAQLEIWLGSSFAMSLLC